MTTTTAAMHHVVTVVRAPSSELDLASSGALLASLEVVHEPQATVVLDLAQVTFIDSSALAVILTVERRLVDEGGRLLLAHPCPRVRNVLRLCGLDHLLMHPGESGSGRGRAAPRRISPLG